MGATDFALEPGRWEVRNRRLVGDRWEEFDAISEAEAMLGGLGNVDHFHAPGYEGFSLRLYDPEPGEWRSWWSSTPRPGRLDPPVEGRFEDGRGRFEADDVLDGVPIRMRFDWTEMTGDSARWDQAFSLDCGKTWEPNWTMWLRRQPSALA